MTEPRDETEWSEHDGGPRPVQGDTLVIAKFRFKTRGKHVQSRVLEAWRLVWEWKRPRKDISNGGDIVSYLVIAPSAAIHSILGKEPL